MLEPATATVLADAPSGDAEDARLAVTAARAQSNANLVMHAINLYAEAKNVNLSAEQGGY